MKKIIGKLIFMFILLVFALTLDDKIPSPFNTDLLSTAEAIVGRPATPVSYAGVARRSPVGVNRHRAGTRGGPVNRVGRR